MVWTLIVLCSILTVALLLVGTVLWSDRNRGFAVIMWFLGVGFGIFTSMPFWAELTDCEYEPVEDGHYKEVCEVWEPW